MRMRPPSDTLQGVMAASAAIVAAAHSKHASKPAFNEKFMRPRSTGFSNAPQMQRRMLLRKIPGECIFWLSISP